MNDAPLPPYLKPKATKLPAGHDDTLDPPEPPTDAAARKTAPFDWAQFDTSKGGDGPPDAPLAPPAVDPAARSVPASTWPRVFDRNRPLRETLAPVPDLDPDIALWPVTILSRWPFAGHPTVGIWPKGWVGVDNTATMYVCTVAGEPGTWAVVGGGGGSIPGGGEGMPIADPFGITTATTTPDPIAGAHSQLWVKFPADASVMAWGIAGDAFPRWVFGAQSGLFLGDGTFDPTQGTGGHLFGSVDSFRGGVVKILGGVPNGNQGVILNGSALSLGLLTTPQGNLGGFAGDLVSSLGVFVGGDLSLWLCTIDGNAAAATWKLVQTFATTDPITAVAVPPNAGALWQDTSGSGSLWISTGTSSGDWALIGGDTGWIDATGLLVNSWTKAVSGVVQYRKKNGVVFVEFNVTGGSNAAVFTLPAGFRPTGPLLNFAIPVDDSGTINSGFCTVSNAGVVGIEDNATTVPTAANVYISFIADA